MRSAPMLGDTRIQLAAHGTGCVTSFRENPLQQLKIFQQRARRNAEDVLNSSAGKLLCSVGRRS